MTQVDIFRALADPTRRAVYERLAKGEMSVSEISQHLAALRHVGLVRERREGRRAYYRVDPDGLRPLANWIDRYRNFWPERIEKLKDVLKRMDP